MFSPEEADLERQWQAAVRELETEFRDTLPAATIQSCLDEVLAEFRDARVKAFVPLLAQRAARERLRALEQPPTSR